MRNPFEIKTRSLKKEATDDRFYVEHCVFYEGKEFLFGKIRFRAKLIDDEWCVDTRLHKEILRLRRRISAKCNQRQLYFKTQAIEEVTTRLETRIKDKVFSQVT